MKVWAIVVGAGSGRRMGKELPKQFLRLGRRTVLAHSLTAMARVEEIDAIVAVVPEEYTASVMRSVRRDPALEKVRAVVAGGAERGDSVMAGLQAIQGPCDVVAIHDAARPLVRPEHVASAVRVAGRFGAAVLAVPAADTIKQSSDQGIVMSTPDRSRLWAAQTPQCFEHNLLLDAYRSAREEGITATDDSALVERLGARVVIVAGDQENFKITTRHDLERARLVLRRRAGEAR